VDVKMVGVTLVEADVESVGWLHPDSAQAAFWRAGTGRKARWRCPRCGHAWDKAVKEIAGRRRGLSCPRCGTVPRRAQSLAVRRPEVAAHWHSTRNMPLTPLLVRITDTTPVWWLCTACGNAYRRTVRLRCARPVPRCRACPRAPMVSAVPGLADLWHPTRNLPAVPEGSPCRLKGSRSYWWRCPAGHEWRRTVPGKGLPACPRCRETNSGALASTRRRIRAALADGRLRPEVRYDIRQLAAALEVHVQTLHTKKTILPPRQPQPRARGGGMPRLTWLGSDLAVWAEEPAVAVADGTHQDAR
jgi:hypothetical protein